MSRKRALILGVLAITTSMFGQDLKNKFVGKSDCIQEFRSPIGRSAIRLDRKQRAYLTSYQMKDENLLVFVQYHNDQEQCGVVRDVVRARDLTASFVWECVDPRDPSAVVVGIWPAAHPKIKGPSREAWRVDIEKLKFVPIHKTVNCKAGDYAGSDEGDGLTDWAQKRVKKNAKPQ